MRSENKFESESDLVKHQSPIVEQGITGISVVIVD
jgi:hypothetical protein